MHAVPEDQEVTEDDDVAGGRVALLASSSAAASSMMLFPADDPLTSPGTEDDTEPGSSDTGDDFDMDFVREAAAEELQSVIRRKLARNSVTRMRVEQLEERERSVRLEVERKRQAEWDRRASAIQKVERGRQGRRHVAEEREEAEEQERRRRAQLARRNSRVNAFAAKVNEEHERELNKLQATDSAAVYHPVPAEYSRRLSVASTTRRMSSFTTPPILSHQTDGASSARRASFASASPQARTAPTPPPHTAPLPRRPSTLPPPNAANGQLAPRRLSMTAGGLPREPVPHSDESSAPLAAFRNGRTPPSRMSRVSGESVTSISSSGSSHAADAPAAAAVVGASQEDRALAGQVATLLNVLRCVDAINMVLGNRLIKSPYIAQQAAPYGSLLAWSNGVILQRFAAAPTYIKLARAFGMLYWEKRDLAANSVIHSSSIGASRRDMLDAAMARPQLIHAAGGAGPEVADRLRHRLQTTPMLAKLVEDFLRGDVTSDMRGLEASQQLGAAVTV